MEYSKNQLTKTSKFLSFVLRHKPEAIGLQLDDSGWALISELIRKADKELNITPSLIERTATTNDKKRFQISANGLYIRASQGHSIKVDLQLTPQEPPAALFHGTATRFLESIQKEGLKAGQRQHVHLSTDIDTAYAVGKRYGKPIILKIDSELMSKHGCIFYISDNNVWLTDNVPSKYISIKK
jgi:putative RNA 2'-phosphotransferase